MSERRLLISGIGGDIGQSIARAVSGAVRCFGADMTPFPAASTFVEDFVLFPPARNVEEYMEALHREVSRLNVDYFLPVSEPEIDALNAHRDQWVDLPAKVLINSPEVLEVCLDKLNTARFLRDSGLNSPQSELLGDYRGGATFPVIVKHRQTWGGRKVWTVEAPEELEQLRVGDDGGLIVQEKLGDVSEEYTTGVFSDGTNVSTISFRRYLGYGGLTREAFLVQDASLAELGAKIARGLDLRGAINVQSRRVERGFVPFEINPRISSTVGIRAHYGFEDVLWWLDLLDGRSHSFVPRVRTGYAIRYLVEAYLDADG
ncbi:MAG: ATP-grasp domain-containing protein [Gemmatimonadetes bacterium]|nr:ATP-grasp domain-containing protein [Gemmatimonadota bacterium]